MNKLLQKLPAIGITTLLRCYFIVPLVVIFFLSGGGWVLPGVMLLGSLIVLQYPFYLLIRLLVPHSLQIEESTLAVVAEPRPSYRFVLGSDLQRDGMFLELEEEQSRTVVAEVFYSDVTKQMSLTMYEKNVPVDVIKMLLARAETDLPPRN